MNHHCEYNDCDKETDIRVYDRSAGKVIYVCEDHLYIFIDKDWPQYTIKCVDCGCWQGVG